MTSELNIFVDENNVEAGGREILKEVRPEWNLDLVRFKFFTDGITNKLIGCFYQNSNSSKSEEVLLIRIYGNKTDLLIDRNAEKRNIKFLHDHGLAPKLYATFNNGLVYEFVPGCTLKYSTLQDPTIWRLVAQNMARMHKLPIKLCGAGDGNVEPMLKTKSVKFLDLVPDRFTDPVKDERVKATLPTKDGFIREFNFLYDVLEKTKSPILFCHNDLLPGNVIYTQERNSVTFIDYEYAEPNFQAFDIGNHFAEFPGIGSNAEIDYTKYPSRDYQLQWIKVYLEEYHGREASKDEIEQLYKDVNKFALSSHFLWALWSLIQAEHSTIDFDFVAFAAIRYNEYLARRDEFMNL